jgi:hypothetical protein
VAHPSRLFVNRAIRLLLREKINDRKRRERQRGKEKDGLSGKRAQAKPQWEDIEKHYP